MPKIFDFNEKRNQVVEEKRRNFERVVFDNLVGAYTVVDSKESIYPIKLVDISNSGCLFQVPESIKGENAFEKNKEIVIRMYFTKKSYLPINVVIKYAKRHVENRSNYTRYGAEFDSSTESFKALEKFIQFLYLYSDLSHLDKGDNKIYFL